MTDAKALPLQLGDQIRVEASVSRPSFLYLVWIGTDGAVSPVYPWATGDWSTRNDEVRRSRISLPEPADKGWPLAGDAGMETLYLLARETPLPDEVDLSDLFSDLPSQKLQDNRAIVWWEQGQVSKDPTRAPQFFILQEIDDPVLKTQRLLAERLKDYFPLMCAVSFANRGR